MAAVAQNQVQKYNPKLMCNVAIKQANGDNFWSIYNKQDDSKMNSCESNVTATSTFQSIPSRGQNKINLFANNGKYVMIKRDIGGQGIHALAKQPKTWELFTLEPITSQLIQDKTNLYAIKCDNGKYITSNGKGWLIANSSNIGFNQMFRIIPQ
mmetsp:Transcript_24365/g.21294  ORF Transcript_24365/g.21294 Transcript_24365/m.21294 type:complete len:154 (+) Transcript_24365:74-535(+)